MAGERPSLAELVEVLRAEQRGRWQDGERVVAETYFAQHPSLLGDTTRALQLVYNEVLLREEEGTGPQLAEYVRRFPQLSAQLAPLFEVHRALESDEFLAAGANDVSSDRTLPQNEPEATGPWPTVAGHEILGELGRGGMGVVYKARQVGLNRVVALKMILAGKHANPAQLARFRAEAEAVARLQHPNIVQIHDVGEQDGCPYFSLEFVDGVSLAQALKGTPQPARPAAGLILTLARAIHCAHQHGVIHRDLKPANVLLTTETQRHRDDSNPEVNQDASLCLGASVVSLIPKITDFGLAKQLDAGAAQTASGMVLGTPSYMAPEQADSRAQDIGPATDVYALGAILYELLTGRPPFKAETQLDTLRQVLADEPVPLSRFHLKVPRDLNTICLKCLRKEPHKRYGSALALAADLERFLADQPIRARRTSLSGQVWRWCRRKPAVAGLVFVVFGLLVTAAVGATLAALWLRDEGNATRAQLQLTEKAEDAAKRRLFGSLVAQARASRLSQRIGQRFKTLDVLTEATRLARSLNLGEDQFRELRSEALACFALADVRVAREWSGWPAGNFSLDFDGAFERYARVDRQGVVSIRRVADDTELYHLPTLGPGETVPMFSDDGRFLVVACRPRMKVWKLTDREPDALLEVPDCSSYTFSPDSRQLAVGHLNGTMSIHDLAAGRERQRLQTAGPALALAFHPKNRQLAASSEHGVQVLDLDTGRVVADFAPATGADALAWHPEGTLLAVVGDDLRITLWDVPAGKPGHVLEGCKNGGIHVTFNHAGDLLASIGWEGILRLWDPQSGKQVFSTQASPTLRFSRDDRRLAAEPQGDRLRILEVAAGREYRTLAHDSALGGIATSPRQHLLAAGMRDGVGLCDLASGKNLPAIKLPQTYHVLFEPSGALLTNGPAGVWRFPIDQEPPLVGPLRIGPPEKLSLPGSICQVAQSRDGRVLASAQSDGALVVQRDKPGPAIRLGPHADVRYIAVSPDGRLVATGSHNGTGVKIWDSRSGKVVKELLPGVSHSLVGFSPNGKWLATSGGGCRLWAVEDWQAGPQLGGNAFAFSPDGTLLAVETGYGVVRLVDPETGREYVRMEDPNQHRAAYMSFSQDGTQLLASNIDGPSIHVWDLRGIRRQLAELGLDWDLPRYPSSPAGEDSQALRLAVQTGALAETFPTPLRQALTTYSLAIALLPLNPEAHYQRGLAHALLEQWPEALDDCTRSLLLRNDHVQAYYLRGQVRQQLGRHRQAVADFSEALRREPVRVPSLAEVQKVLALDPRSADEQNTLGWRYVSGPAERCVPGLATLLAEKAVLLDPGNWYFRNTLGVAYYRLGLWQQAADTLQGSLRLHPGRMEAFDLLFLAMTYQKLGQAARAIAYYERVLQQARSPLSLSQERELTTLCAEAAAVLGLPATPPFPAEGRAVPTQQPR